MDQIKLNKYTRYFLEGKLSQDRETELLNWIKLSEENRELFLIEQEKHSETHVNRRNIVLNQKWKSVQKRIQPRNSIRNLYVKVASVAAAFIVGVLLTTIVSNYGNFFWSQSAEIQNITTPFGAKTNIKLPDGSLVWLNSGSTLSYPSKFSKNRSITLIGEGFFEVVKNNKPFIVSTNYGEVEVKGTSFNVKAFADESLQTTLVTGSVLVREKDSEKEVALQPGEQANVINKQIFVTRVATDVFTSWKDGKLIFKHEYLPVAVKRLERWYNVKIILDDDKRLEKIWFSGTLEMESFTEVLELLKVTSSIDYNYNEKTRTIRIHYKQN